MWCLWLTEVALQKNHSIFMNKSTIYKVSNLLLFSNIHKKIAQIKFDFLSSFHYKDHKLSKVYQRYY